jgi:hypothetical protein
MVALNTISPPAPKYAVIDGRTGQQVGGDYTSRDRARNRADKLDNAYGGYRYSVAVKR